ncbi:exopolysaccharide biosynthesis protein [Palleronia sediminis]|uniref:Exopolysaccharide biosynthesis protein n=1 Tax=Palleronia sediminis TaxID=2547833 RepID=A0A4R6ABI5_9RHOB|nr:exopolysaccharide biosynthesis protein [Palleronia sediminis]TDL81321.1 exopolysaccharide biosynthesis protein [Palleronia sediminis]
MAQDISDILDDLDELAGQESEVSLGDVVERIGPRGPGVMLFLPGALGATPVGGIPGMPSVIGLFVAMLSVQILIGRNHLWLPGFLRRRSVGDDRLRGSVARLRKPAGWIDRHFGQRLEWAAGEVARRVVAGICLVLAATLPPLEVVPFAALAPFAAIGLNGLALTLRDGLLTLAGVAASLAALWSIWAVLPFG